MDFRTKISHILNQIKLILIEELFFLRWLSDAAKADKVVIINNLFQDAVSVVSIATGVVCAYVMGEHAQRPYWVLAAQDWHTFTPCLSPSAVRDSGEALLICHKLSNRGSQK